MHRPTARVLTILELLQARWGMTGRELARRLEVDERTVRRYVATLQEMGVPVEGQRGRYGAYRLRPGYKLPPMMFTDEEALAKVERVMPETLRERVRALERTVSLPGAPPKVQPDAGTISELAGAVGERRRVRLRHRSARLEETERTVDPYALLQREGHWYLFGHCHLRRGARLFRVDRVLGAEVLGETFERPPELDGPEGEETEGGVLMRYREPGRDGARPLGALLPLRDQEARRA